ncbi:MAG TPA: TIGR03118 family protein [Actinomycetota bacterium]|jgi:uncharacterized protein (TIGR03118 family)|nr:TIGR03118 family protein [Actinomycetota bacterium]
MPALAQRAKPTVPRRSPRPKRLTRLALAIGITAALLAVGPSAVAHPSGRQQRTAYHQTNQVSDIPGRAAITDPNLVNPWGLVAGPTTPLWSNDQGKGVSTLYNGAVNGSAPAIIPLVVAVPGGLDTGIVFNAAPGFTVTAPNGAADSARFIFANLLGQISGWSPTLPLNGNAVLEASVPGHSYTGLANLTTDEGSFLFAANFDGTGGSIDVFDSNWNPVRSKEGFKDRHIPRGYAPFNIQALGDELFVAYARFDPVTGRADRFARGFVDVFNADGKLLDRLIHHDRLHAPWGMVIAPEGFGRFSGDLLVGNFGDGRINAFDARNGNFRGTLRDERGRVIVNDRLWALRFGNGVFGGPTDLVFSAGIEDETHGLLGTISAVG